MRWNFGVLALCVMAVVGCGPEHAPEEAATADATVGCADDSCKVAIDDANSSDVIVISLYYTLNLELWNASPFDRNCVLSYDYKEWDGTTTSGLLVRGETLAANGCASTTLRVPANQSVHVSASCWHPGYPEVDIRATNSTDTLYNVNGEYTCRAIYDEAYGPNMAMPCWKE